MKNYILLGIAILAGLTAFVVSKRHIEGELRDLNQKYQQLAVVGFKGNMLRGDAIERDDLMQRVIFKRDKVGDEVLPDQVDDIVGQKLASDVLRYVPIRWDDIAGMARRRLGGSPLADMVGEKERALSLAVDTTSSVSGMVAPNDHVDIIGSFRFPAEEGNAILDTVTLTLLQNVAVLAVGQKLGTTRWGARTMEGISQRSRGYSNITVGVTPKEAELLVFASQKGKLVLTLRNPEDVYMEKDVQDVNWNTLKGNLPQYNQDRQERMEDRR